MFRDNGGALFWTARSEKPRMRGDGSSSMHVGPGLVPLGTTRASDRMRVSRHGNADLTVMQLLVAAEMAGAEGKPKLHIAPPLKR